MRFTWAATAMLSARRRVVFSRSFDAAEHHVAAVVRGSVDMSLLPQPQPLHNTVYQRCQRATKIERRHIPPKHLRQC
jgi:hypothetical protein